jgi:hypothetical protein
MERHCLASAGVLNTKTFNVSRFLFGTADKKTPLLPASRKRSCKSMRFPYARRCAFTSSR